MNKRSVRAYYEREPRLDNHSLCIDDLNRLLDIAHGEHAQDRPKNFLAHECVIRVNVAHDCGRDIPAGGVDRAPENDRTSRRREKGCDAFSMSDADYSRERVRVFGARWVEGAISGQDE